MESKKGFNVFDSMLSGASLKAAGVDEADTGQATTPRPMLKVRPIKLTDLIPSNDNFYAVDKIAELKASIEMFGVLQNLIVKPREGGKFEILAGERRYRACVELVAEGKTEYEYVPCGIQGERDEIKEQILLIITNSTQRELTDYEKMQQAEKLTKHYTALKKRDNLPGRVRDLVAEALNTSSTQVGRMNAIINNLTPELKNEFQAGRIGLSAAYELSGLTEDKQQEAAADIQEKGGLSLNDVRDKKQDPAPTDDTPAAPLPKEPPAPYEPKNYPETPQDFTEGQADNDDETASVDFIDMSAEEKAEAAIAFLQSKRFTLFAPGDDTRVLDFIIETLENHAEARRGI